MKMHQLELKSYHHQLFHYTPKLIALLPAENRDICLSFIEWMLRNKLKMDWTLHMHLLDWLCLHPILQIKMLPPIKKELLVATVIRWSLFPLEHLQAKGIMVKSKHLIGIAVGLWKNSEANNANRIVAIKLPAGSEQNKNSYAIAYQFNNWKQAEWINLGV